MIDDLEYLRMAYRVALNSGDLSTQNGAVLVDPTSGKVVMSGWNDIHHPVVDTPERRTGRPDKYHFTEHAERMVILTAAKYGVRTAGLWMYVPWAACHDCGRAAVYAGITRLVTHDLPEHYSRPDWKPSIDAADAMFREAGVEVVRLKGKVGVKFRFNGAEIEA